MNWMPDDWKPETGELSEAVFFALKELNEQNINFRTVNEGVEERLMNIENALYSISESLEELNSILLLEKSKEIETEF